MLERLDFEDFSDPVWMTQLFRTDLLARWWGLTRNWVLSSDYTFSNCIWRSSFDGMWIATVAVFYFINKFAVCLYAHLSLNLPIIIWIYLLSTSYLEVDEGSLFALPDRLLPVNFGVPSARHRNLFHLMSSFGAVNLSEKVSEVFTSLCLSCSGHACMRINLQLNIALRNPTDAVFSRGVVFGISFACSSRCSFARSSCCRSVLVSIPPFDMRIFDFSARDVFGPSTSICNNHTSCRRRSSL